MVLMPVTFPLWCIAASLSTSMGPNVSPWCKCHGGTPKILMWMWLLKVLPLLPLILMVLLPMVMQNILLKHMDGSKYSKALLLVEPVPSDKLNHVENFYNQVITAVSSITASPQVLPAYMDWTSNTNPKSIFVLPNGHALYDAAMSQFQPSYVGYSTYGIDWLITSKLGCLFMHLTATQWGFELLMKFIAVRSCKEQLLIFWLCSFESFSHFL